MRGDRAHVAGLGWVVSLAVLVGVCGAGKEGRVGGVVSGRGCQKFLSRNAEEETAFQGGPRVRPPLPFPFPFAHATFLVVATSNVFGSFCFFVVKMLAVSVSPLLILKWASCGAALLP